MKKITIWASKNPKKSRTILVFLQFLLIINGIILGTILYKTGIIINKNLIFGIIGIAGISALFYPLTSEKFKLFYFEHTFIRKKVIDAVIASCIFIVAILGANQFQDGTLNYEYITKISAKAVNIEKPNTYNKEESPKVNQKINRNETNSTKNIVTKKRRLFKNKFWLFKKVNPDKKLKGREGWLIALTIIVGVLLILLIIPLACWIFCVGIGLEGAIGVIVAGSGILLLVGGIAGITLGVVSIIRKIRNKIPKQKT